MRPSFFHHLHPPTIPAPQSRLRYTLGAGGFSVFLTLVVLVSGTLELFYYVPVPGQAAESIQTLTYLVPFGGFVRNLHYWSAQLLVLAILIHLLRVILTGAYIRPRRFNYLLGLSLLLLSLFLDFSGYVLRWDQGVQWALVAGTNLLKTIPLLGSGLYTMIIGGSQPGPATLIRFYAWHIFGLMLLLVIFGVWHLFRVRRDGGIAVPPPELRTSPERISRNELVRREAAAAILLGAALVILAAFFPAPIAAPIAENNSPAAEALAPWFFLWVQQLLKLGSPFVWGILVPAGVLLLLALIPYAFPAPDRAELGGWLPRGGRLVQIFTTLLGLALLAASLLAWLGG